ncbi:hypothetical protein M8818_002038 [Zalaria obscura]|uniref:Uncharacterized protein n=1 Tax=Zalaria obscura TaxID=2024903 RepID=A0ACC3SIU7_9PEZI
MTFNPSSSSDPSQEVARFSRWALILHTESQSRIAQHQIDVDGIDQSVGLYRKDNQWCFTQTSESQTCPGEVIAKIGLHGQRLSAGAVEETW